MQAFPFKNKKLDLKSSANIIINVANPVIH